MDKQVEFLLKIRDGCQMLTDAANDYLEAFAPETPQAQPQNQEERQTAAVAELTFTTLRFEAYQGVKLGEYETAYKTSNLEDKWHQAYSILRNSNATIKDRYHGEGYQYSYWLYGDDKIYRQKRKPQN
jgi:hypothetical protein